MEETKGTWISDQENKQERQELITFCLFIFEEDNRV